MWKCPSCGEVLGDQFDMCWKCESPKPAEPEVVAEPVEPAAVWAENFRETKQADGTITVEVFGQSLRCAVCGNTTFHKRSTLLNSRMMTVFSMDWTNKSATNFVCSRCGYIFWFLPQ